MNRPPFIQFLVGNLVVVIAALLVVVIATLGWLGNQASAWVPVMAFGFAAWSSRAYGEVRRWRAWDRRWQSHAAPNAAAAPNTSARPRRGMWIWAAIALCWLYLAATVKTPDQQAGLGLFTVLILAYGVIRLMLRIFRRRTPSAQRDARNGADVPVTLCIERPLYPVPSLHAAYQQLPDYCFHVLNDRADRSSRT